MKKSFRVFAAVLAAIMLLGCCAFAASDNSEARAINSISWGCSCAPTISTASSYSDDVVQIGAEFHGSVFISGIGTYPIGDSFYTVGSYADAGETYSQANFGNIRSTHEIDGVTYRDSDSF